MARKDRKKEASEEPDLLYIFMIKALPNGAILPGFRNAAIYPGQTIKVRGENGLRFHQAQKLVNSGNFVWSDGAGTQLMKDPEPTEDEAKELEANGAVQLAGSNAVVTPQYHKVDREYKGPLQIPSLVREQRLLALQETATTEEDFMPQELAINRTYVERRKETTDPAEGVTTED